MLRNLFRFGHSASIEKTQTPPTTDFRHLVEGDGWQSLPSAIIKRFDTMSTGLQRVNYTGHMAVQRSKIGWLFCYLCRLFGSPLVREQGNDVAVDVAVFAKDNGICWQRDFHFDNQRPIRVESLKIVDETHGLLECISHGLNMKLRVYAQDGQLHFVSNAYYLKLKKRFIPLPYLLTPGTLHVAHIDEGNGHFRFTMSFDHPLFGRTFYQDGVFKRKEKDQL